MQIRIRYHCFGFILDKVAGIMHMTDGLSDCQLTGGPGGPVSPSRPSSPGRPGPPTSP